METNDYKISESGYCPKIELQSNTNWRNYYRESSAVEHYLESDNSSAPT